MALGIVSLIVLLLIIIIIASLSQLVRIMIRGIILLALCRMSPSPKLLLAEVSPDLSRRWISY